MHNQYNRLRAWLDKLLDSEFRDLVRSFLKPAEQSHLPAPVESLNRGDFLGAVQRLDRLADLENYLGEHCADRKPSSNDVAPAAQPAHPPPSAPPQRIPFTNREDEINLILSSYAPAYYLLDAPAGYGKTELLRELERRFKEKHWVCAYSSGEEDGTLPKLVAVLAQQLELDRDIALEQDAERLALNLSGELQKQRLEDITKEGLVLLIDLEGKPCLPVMPELLGKFIPNIQDSLRTLEFFATKHNRFRVVLAGRYLAGRREIPESAIPLEIRRLTPFSYEIVRDTAREYLVGHDENSIAQIAAHLMYLTGGHPGCIAQTLEMYREKRFPPDRFLKYFGKQIWEGIVRSVVENVRNGIQSSQLREVLDRLSVLRYMDYEVLGRLIEEEEKHDLADKLTNTYLLDWKIRLLRDDITRRLLAIRLRGELGAEVFSARCKKAQAVCADHLQDPTIQMPEMWAIEYLFQALQQHAATIQKPQERKVIRQTFLNVEIPKALRMLVTGRNWRVERNALKQALKEDWEFRFTVNYYLREEQYSSAPYEEVLQRIEQFFTQEGAHNG